MPAFIQATTYVEAFVDDTCKRGLPERQMRLWMAALFDQPQLPFHL